MHLHVARDQFGRDVLLQPEHAAAFVRRLASCIAGEQRNPQSIFLAPYRRLFGVRFGYQAF